MTDILIEEAEGALWAVAVAGDGRLEAVEVDTPREDVRWGTVYWAQVKAVDKARDAAFVDLGDGKTGIVYSKSLRFLAEDGGVTKGGHAPITQLLSAGARLLVQAKTAYIETGDDRSRLENKIPEISMDISIQGRFLIYCPFLRRNQLSQRIGSKSLRAQLSLMLQDMEAKGQVGYIVRAASAHTQTDILEREAVLLQSMWEQMESTVGGMEGSGPVAAGLDAVQRVLSDMAGDMVECIEVVTMEHLEHVTQWCSAFAPELVPKITPVVLSDAEEDLALLYARDVMEQVDALAQPVCNLPHGGHLIIQATAALTAIDVNKGGDGRSHLQTNISAGVEALRQLRLRNIGGVVVLDALAMRSEKDRLHFVSVMRREAAQDPCTVQIHGLTGTGLLEISRKRRTAELRDRLI